MRTLGIDLGARRTGLALSDSGGIICSPVGVLDERDEERLLQKIMEVVRKQEVGEIVVGLPRPLSGGTNRQLESVLRFVGLLRRDSSVRVVAWDERFTSKLAAAGRRGQRPDDAIAACYMLQSYLDSCVAK